MQGIWAHSTSCCGRPQAILAAFTVGFSALRVRELLRDSAPMFDSHGLSLRCVFRLPADGRANYARDAGSEPMMEQDPNTHMDFFYFAGGMVRV